MRARCDILHRASCKLRGQLLPSRGRLLYRSGCPIPTTGTAAHRSYNFSFQQLQQERRFSNGSGDDYDPQNPFERQVCEDTQLQKSFEGIWPKLQLLPRLFVLNSPAQVEFEKLEETGVVLPLHLLNHLVLYTQLQNPLLLKYGFNPQEFMTGARKAFETVHTAIASRDFANYAKQLQDKEKGVDLPYEHPSEANELLANTLSPALYTACLAAVTHLQSGGQDMILTDVQVKRSMMLGVGTQIASLLSTASADGTAATTTTANGGTTADTSTAAMVDKNTELGSTTQENMTDSNSQANNAAAAAAATVDADQMLNSNLSTAAKHETGTAANNSNVSNSNNSSSSSNSSSDSSDSSDSSNSSSSAQLYIPGSVIATVDVLIEAEESYKIYSAFSGEQQLHSADVEQSDNHIGSSSNNSDNSNNSNNRDSSDATNDISSTTAPTEPAASISSEDDKTDSQASTVRTTTKMAGDAPKRLTRKTSTRWTFRGCISGQTELDWQIIGFDGTGVESAPAV